MAKVFAVRSSIDCPDRRNKAHSVCRGHLATTPDLRQGQCCLKINQPGIRTGNSFSLQVVESMKNRGAVTKWGHLPGLE